MISNNIHVIHHTTHIIHVKKLDQGKQGITGLVTIDDTKYVYKISQYMNYLVDHEFLILNGLNDLNAKCPHFCKVKGKYLLPIHPNFRELEQDPFEKHERPIMLNVIFIEYIENSFSLYSLMKTNEYDFNEILYYIKQTLITLIISQKYKKFVHYDLHSMNILLQDCSIDKVNVYVLDSKNSICIPTLGHDIKIIDYGFAYSNDLLNHPSYISLAYTDAGFMSPAFDSIADIKLFLVSVIDDLDEVFYSDDGEYKYFKKYKNIIYNIFKSLNIDWRSGWDNTNDVPIIDQILDYIENVEEESLLFREYSNFCIDMLQSLIILPYRPKIESTMNDLRKTYNVFIREFLKIETEISNPFYSLYILRQMIDLARDLRVMYLNDETRDRAIYTFQINLFEQINSIARYCTLKTVNYNKILCSLYLFSDQLEYQLYKMLNKYMERKYKNYLSLDINCTEHVFGVLDLNFKDEYIYDTYNIFHVFDCVKNENKMIKLNEQNIEILNNLHHVLKGQFIYNLYSNNDYDDYVEELENEERDYEENNENSEYEESQEYEKYQNEKQYESSELEEDVNENNEEKRDNDNNDELICTENINNNEENKNELKKEIEIKNILSPIENQYQKSYTCEVIIKRGKNKGKPCGKKYCTHQKT